uniref:Uncharacterized protein n=1 Tax=Picea sitchensis TaxID=3332 RepID=D5A8M3_PICSI|nr:unknown [Picea sitchensis]
MYILFYQCIRYNPGLHLSMPIPDRIFQQNPCNFGLSINLF